jgi:hypothetical protein
LNNSTRPNQSKNKDAYQEKLEEREAWHKLVVKVLKCKDGDTSDMLSIHEWETYCKKISETNLTYGKDQVKANLQETWEIINNNHGFISI